MDELVGGVICELHSAKLKLLHLYIAASDRIWQCFEFLAHLFKFFLKLESVIETLNLSC